jgi:hypothetical protein
VPVGNHTLLVYATEPNDSTDEDNGNDTTQLAFGVKTVVPLPVKEDFESSTFPANQWNQVNPDNKNSWQKTNLASRNGVSSIQMKNFDYAPAGQTDEFISPLVNYANVDSVYLQFQLSAATFSFPGSTEVPLDTLEVLVSTDCGKTYTTVYKKWGAELQTLGNVNSGNTSEFIPRSQREWRLEEINLTYLLGRSNTFLVSFRNKGNTENNIYIDDIHIFTTVLPAKLKNNGYLISPNPFRNRFLLQHYPTAEKFKGLDIFNSMGQKVYSNMISPGSGASSIDVNLGSLPAGVYMVRLLYTDKIITERVIKQN